ncbi:AraC family transcriptional regulator [Anaeromicropila populeti]|uniref:Transcriptional regulator, AraC family n=1 Tax=Anaeromicropila populeti TaxID=37658 RepID=A0A1I6IM36_9FIRM|nr:AraC family transcriptional regulator [Anaeromicropila populeti]SFR67754.1 transcriptional regulator, AraC family [Anaeromicropila populeti]
MVAMTLNAFTKDTSFPFYIQYGFHDTNLYIHTHADFSELVIVLQGTALHIVDNNSYPIRKGDVFVICNNTSHGYENTYDFKICNIMYRPELLSSELDLRSLAGYHALFVLEPYLSMEHSFQGRLKLKMNDFDNVSNMISCMITEYAEKKEGWKAILISYFIKLVVILSRAYSFTSSVEKCDIIQIAKSVSYIENHYTEALTIKDLAEISNFSTRHFTRIFRITYETTPGNYILSLRMQHACSLLKNTNLTITEIALQSGFSDSNYFSRQFRKFFHITPCQFRKMNHPNYNHQ